MHNFSRKYYLIAQSPSFPTGKEGIVIFSPGNQALGQPAPIKGAGSTSPPFTVNSKWQ